MVFLFKLTTFWVRPLGFQLLEAHLSKKCCSFAASRKGKGRRRYSNISRTRCQSTQQPSPEFEKDWMKAEEAEISSLLEHDFHIDTDPRKIDWPPNELRYDPEELRRRYAPHVSYDPVPLSSENLPILWDTPRVLSLLRLILYVPFVSFLFFKNHLACDVILILSTCLLWLRKKSEAFVQCQDTFLTFLEPLVNKSMFWSCLIGIAVQDNSTWVSTFIWFLVPAEFFIFTLREWTTFCGRRFEAGYRVNIVESVFEVFAVLLLDISFYLKFWKCIGYCCSYILTAWRLWTCVHYARSAFEDRQQSEKRTMF